MKKVIEIFKRDISRLGKSPAAIIVAVGMCIIPALYAWFNIAANRDPYGNTANIKVAVANNDVGAENKKRTLDAGRQILDQMEENDDLGWVFTDEEDAVDGVKSGKYYAAIVIPETFTPITGSHFATRRSTSRFNSFFLRAISAASSSLFSERRSPASLYFCRYFRIHSIRSPANATIRASLI